MNDTAHLDKDMGSKRCRELALLDLALALADALIGFFCVH